jgi:lipid-binding SYLF domain-containing protein
VFVKLEGGSFGWQIGGQSTDLILVAMNENGLQHMLSAKFKIGGDAAASAGPVGRNAQAGTDWKLNSEFLTYSRSKGLFAGIDLDGTVLSQDGDDTRTEYGADIPFDHVLHVARKPLDLVGFERAAFRPPVLLAFRTSVQAPVGT